MVERQGGDRLTPILKAASDATRRAVLVLLAQEGPLKVTDIAARFDMSLNGISKHIKVLEGAGLVRRQTDWREHLIEVDLGVLAEIDAFFASLRSIWALRLDALNDVLTKDAAMTDDLTLQVDRLISAPAERCFDAWLSPEMLSRFMTPGPGMTVTEARADPVIGGAYRIVMQAPDGTQIPHWGAYLEIDRPNRLAFTWASKHSVEGSTVTLTFAPEGDRTRVTLTHVRFVDEASRDQHIGGWTGILDAMAQALA